METSIVANFDEMKRCYDVLSDGTAEIEFRRFVGITRESQLEWQSTVAEAQRLQRELDKMQRKFEECLKERSDFETKLCHARRLLESESKARRQLEEKLLRVSEFLHTDQNMNNDIRSTLESLNVSGRKRKLNGQRYADEQNGNEINSTCSFLSNLSATQFDDDLLNVTRPYKKHRPSSILSNISYVDTNQRLHRRTITETKKNLSVQELNESEQIVATAKVVIPYDDRPIEAMSTIEAVPKQQQDNKSSESEHLVPIHRSESVQTEKIEEEDRISKMSSFSVQSNKDDASNAQHEIAKEPKPMFNFPVRQHDLATRTVLRPHEVCACCQKKIHFGRTIMKCRSCGVQLHQDCKNQYTLVCIPKGQGRLNTKQGYIADYVPTNSPMIPPIVLHCINEIEMRGLNEKGIYRVSGAEKEVKALKERILRGKSALNLSNVDIHVICGCIKDFLRGLKEPLIPTVLWKHFANAVQMIEDSSIERELHAAINQLPQPNRETLAFLILHLQRVGNSKAVQMPIENLARIFGPTILGYSCDEPDHNVMLSETLVQKDVMENLLKLKANFWARIFKNDLSAESSTSTVSRYSYFGSPNLKNNNTTQRKEHKFFATPPRNSRF